MKQKKNKRIVLIFWNVRESDKLAATLRKKGSNVDISYEISGLTKLKKLKDDPPSAIIIPVGRIDLKDQDIENLEDLKDLSSIIPIIFIDGDESSINDTKKKFPSAKFTSLSKLPNILDGL